MSAQPVTSDTPDIEHAAHAFAAMRMAAACMCSVVPMSIDGVRWFARFCLNSEEHQRRSSTGLGPVTDTGLLHALWSLPEDVQISLARLEERDAVTLARHGGGHLVDNGATVSRSFRPAGAVTAVAAVAGNLESAIRRIAALPPIYTRVAISSQAGRRPLQSELDAASDSGIGVAWIDNESQTPRIALLPASPVLGVPAVYRWLVAELAYRNWGYAHCAHCSS